MGRKEEPIIEYCEKSHNFADLLNGWMFAGRKAILPEQVHSVDSRYTAKSGKGRSARYRTRYRDVVKHVEGAYIRVIIGTEMQSYIDYAMPVRVMDYDALEYKSQAASLRRRHRAEEPQKVFLSDMQKEDRLTPALTLVLYFGTKAWDSAKNLHGILDFTGIPRELKKYIPDYPVYVLDICHESDERLLEFPRNLACMFMILKYQKNKEKLLEVLENVEAFQQVDGEMYDAVWTYTNEKKLLELKEQAEDENGGVNVCQAIRELVKDAREEGIAQGISRGVAQGIANGIQILIETLQELHMEESEISAKIAQKYRIPIQDAEEYVAKYRIKDMV